VSQGLSLGHVLFGRDASAAGHDRGTANGLRQRSWNAGPRGPAPKANVACGKCRYWLSPNVPVKRIQAGEVALTETTRGETARPDAAWSTTSTLYASNTASASFGQQRFSCAKRPGRK
jgi:hypothetical protein